MTTPDQHDRLFPLLEEYVERLHRGDSADRAAILRAHPELATVLDCVDGLEQLLPRAEAEGFTLLLHSEQDAAAAMGNPATGETLGQIGDFELLDELGRGGMGVVYRARQKSLDRLVAVKVIVGGRLASREHVRRFATEAKAAAQAEHPNVVSVFEAGRAGGQPYLAMSYVEGVDLGALAAGGRLEIESAARIMITVARAVEHMHNHGIVHRDLKPSNILIDKSGQPFVTDFGLAKLVGADAEQTATGWIAGTPSYMAPEQAAGRLSDVGPATDIYALGAILYMLLTGMPPFRADTPLDTIVQVVEREPVHPRVIDRRIPRALELICLKCLEKNPARRYRRAAELADDLERFLKAEDIEAQTPRIDQRIWRWGRRSPALAAHLAALAAFLSVEFVNFYALRVVDAYFHYSVLAVAAIWAAASCVCQYFLKRPRWTVAARFAWGGIDVLCYTMVMRFADGAASPLVVGYPMLIVGSGLWFRVRLVWFVTALSLLSYLGLVAEFYLNPTPNQLVFDRAYDRPIFFCFALFTIGAVLAFQIARVRALSRYYEQRALP